MSNTAFSLIGIGGSSGGGSGSPYAMDFRLTLASNTPVMSSPVTGATTLYLTPYVGNSIGLYSSGAWSTFTSAQVNISLSDLTADTNYDAFAYNNGGNVTLELLAWGNSGAGTSARATALAYQDGVLVKSGDATRRYVGTIRITGTTGQCEFSFGSDNTEAKLFIWNYYNPVPVYADVYTTNISWTYNAISTFRTVLGGYFFRVSFVQGLAERSLNCTYTAYSTCGTTLNSVFTGVGLNSIFSPTGVQALSNTGGAVVQLVSSYTGVATPGFNYLQALEGSGNVNVTSYSNSSYYRNGLQFSGLF